HVLAPPDPRDHPLLVGRAGHRRELIPGPERDLDPGAPGEGDDLLQRTPAARQHRDLVGAPAALPKQLEHRVSTVERPSLRSRLAHLTRRPLPAGALRRVLVVAPSAWSSPRS